MVELILIFLLFLKEILAMSWLVAKMSNQPVKKDHYQKHCKNMAADSMRAIMFPEMCYQVVTGSLQLIN